MSAGVIGFLLGLSLGGITGLVLGLTFGGDDE